jgi:hypothetical protein
MEKFMKATKRENFRETEVSRDRGRIRIVWVDHPYVLQRTFTFGKVRQHISSGILNKNIPKWVANAKLGSPKLVCPDCERILDFVKEYRTKSFPKGTYLCERCRIHWVGATKSELFPTLQVRLSAGRS